MIFSDAKILDDLGKLFSQQSARFDELVLAAELDPTKDLIGADLRGAVFDGSVMDGWNLSGCDLTGASFIGARIRDLVAAGAVGLDLRGAEQFSESTDATGKRPTDELSWLIAQIEKNTRAKQRRPFLDRLVQEFGRDDRAWDFLLRYLPRERAADHVSWIIRKWESTRSEEAGNELRMRLLKSGGSSYITVRARLLRELASRLGPTDVILDLAVTILREEGAFSSGAVAISVLSTLFRGDPRAEAALKDAMSDSRWWFPPTEDITAALMLSFDTPSTRDFIERYILDRTNHESRRARTLESYVKHDGSEDALRLAQSIFYSDDRAEMRASAVKAQAANQVYGMASKNLEEIASNDRSDEVRAAAICALGSQSSDIDFVFKRAVADEAASVRASAVSVIDSQDCADAEWFLQIFRNDPADQVRSVALSWLLDNVGDEGAIAVRDALMKEIARADPSYAAGRAAFELIRRWPDPEILKQVAGLLHRLPKNTGGWNNILHQLLQKQSGSTVQTSEDK